MWTQTNALKCCTQTYTYSIKPIEDSPLDDTALSPGKEPVVLIGWVPVSNAILFNVPLQRLVCAMLDLSAHLLHGTTTLTACCCKGFQCAHWACNSSLCAPHVALQDG